MELYKKEINSIVDGISIKDFESVIISYGNNKMTISTYHDQDCCERVYGDFNQVQNIISEVQGQKIENILIKGVNDMGFLIIFKKEYCESSKVFVPCYNSQNGYYSSSLSLIIINNEVKTEIDISNFVEDSID
jgi:hypothetical protein